MKIENIDCMYTVCVYIHYVQLQSKICCDVFKDDYKQIINITYTHNTLCNIDLKDSTVGFDMKT